MRKRGRHLKISVTATKKNTLNGQLTRSGTKRGNGDCKLRLNGWPKANHRIGNISKRAAQTFQPAVSSSIAAHSRSRAWTNEERDAVGVTGVRASQSNRSRSIRDSASHQVRR